MNTPRALWLAGWVSTISAFLLVGLGVHQALIGVAWHTTLRNGDVDRTLVVSNPNLLIGGSAIAAVGVLALVAARALVAATQPQSATAQQAVAADAAARRR